MALSTQPYKGARDFYPEDMRLQKYIFAKWRTVCERFGYEEYDAPILEPTELYLSKGNAEIITDQTFTFKDRGDRSITMRTEMTPSVSRLVASKRQELTYPLRWYSIPQCWRYERMQRGRGREFYQLNVDIFGVEGLEADYEMIEMADQIMQEFGAKRDSYTIKVNSRQLIDSLLNEVLGFDPTQTQTLKHLIDRKTKMDYPSFVGQLEGICRPSQREAGVNERLLEFLSLTGLETIPEALSKHSSIIELSQLIAKLQKAGVSNVVFDPSLMRGFEYYTDIAFEVFDTNPDNNRAMFGGGRYDGLIDTLFGGGPMPAAGFAMGDITLKNFLETHQLLPKLRSATDLYVILPSNELEAAQAAISELREMGINVAVDTSGRKVDAQLKSAVKKSIRYAVFIGPKELASEQFELKDLETSTSETHGLPRIAAIVKDYRQK